jgi:hypothetical protein
MDNELEKLFTKAAIALTGDPEVLIRYRHPAIREFNGLAVKIGGWHVIDIDPHLSDDGMVSVLVHECAHVRLGHIEQLEAVEASGKPVLKNDPNAEPGSLTLGAYGLNAYKNSSINSQLEAEAEALADRWLNFADQHMKDYSVYRDDAERRLLALSKWVDTEPAEIEAWKKHQTELTDNFVSTWKRKGLKNVEPKK